MVFSKPMGQTDPGGRNYTGEYKNIFIFLIRPKTRSALLSEEERDEKGYHFTEKSLKVIEKSEMTRSRRMMQSCDTAPAQYAAHN